MSERNVTISSEEDYQEEEDEEEDEEETIQSETEVIIESSVKKDIVSREDFSMAIAAVDPSLQSEMQEDLPTSIKAVQHNLIRMDVQQNVTMTGSVNLTIGGTQNITKIKSTVDGLLGTTISKLDQWTTGIVETAILEKVMDKIDRGVTWITIKGSPGEGKTTTAHMALNKLHKAGRKIFDVATPDEFLNVVNTCKDNPVILLDDVFGNLEFDKTAWSKWKAILLKTLEDTQSAKKQDIPKEESKVTVILVGREYVLNVCTSDLGKVADFFTHEEHVVNMSTASQRKVEEKVKIWNAISAANGVELDADTIQKICKIDLPHGFPHVCKWFVTSRKENCELSAEKFFQKPLEFLNQTIQKFIQNKQKCNLFKAMLKNGGKISLKEMEKLKDPAVIHVASDLVGTYLKREDNYYKFDHPSVYDSVAFNMCTVATSFVITNCEMNFIHEHIRLQTNQKLVTGSDLVVSVARDWIPELAARFASVISARNFSQSLCHQAFTDENFVETTMQNVTIPLTKLVKQSDKTTGQSFLCLLPSSGSPELLKYIEKHASFKLTQSDYKEVSHGVCLFAASDVLLYMKSKFDVNDSPEVKSHGHLNVYDELKPHDGVNFAMISAKGRNVSFVSKIMSMNPDLHTRNAHGQTLLHVLAENGLTVAVKEAIKKEADVNSRDKRNWTPLTYACWTCHEKTAQFLIENGANVNIKDRDGSTLLFYACKKNLEVIAQALVQRGVTVIDNEFFAACETGNLNLVELLVQNAYDVSQYADTSSSLLQAAITSRNIKMVEWLIQHGVSVNSQGTRYGAPLNRACSSGLLEIVKLLLENGADINAVSTTDISSFECAYSEECFDILLTANQNFLTKDTHGNTLLHIAAYKGFTESIRKLLQVFPDVDVLNDEKVTPLFFASRQGSSESVKLLLNAGADVNAKSTRGDTSLHEAGNSAECVQLLVRAGASVNAVNDENKSVLQSTLDLPKKYGSEAPEELGASVEILIKANADVNVRDNDDNTLLHFALELKLYVPNIITSLLQAGANFQLTNVKGQTPLHIATERWGFDAMKELISRGASVNTRDAEGKVPLHYLTPWIPGHKEKFQLLVDSGADVNKKTYHGGIVHQSFLSQ